MGHPAHVFIRDRLLPMHVLACALGNGADPSWGSDLPTCSPSAEGALDGVKQTKCVLRERGSLQLGGSNWSVSHGAKLWTVAPLQGAAPTPAPARPVTSSRSSSGVHGVWSVLSVW